MTNKKLKLNDLKVTSFTTTLSSAECGDLQGAQDGQVVVIFTVPIQIGANSRDISCLHPCMTDEYITCARDCVYPEPQPAG